MFVNPLGQFAGILFGAEALTVRESFSATLPLRRTTLACGNSSSSTNTEAAMRRRAAFIVKVFALKQVDR